MNDNHEVPIHLLRYLADSEFQVISWNEERLAIRVCKEIGPEHGLLEFLDPSFVCLAPKMGIAAISMGSVGDLPTGFLDLMRPFDKQLDESEKVFLVEGSWGERYFVVAAAIHYTIT